MQDSTNAPGDDPAGLRWWVAAAVVAALCLVDAVVPGDGAHALLYTVGVIALAGGFAVAVRRRGLLPTAGWTTFAGGLSLLALGDVVYVLPSGTEIARTGLTWADPLYLVGSVVMAAGALRIKGAHTGERDREALLDAASVALAAGVVLWRPLIEPRLNVADTTLLARLVNGSFPVLDVVVVAMMLWLLLGGRRWTAATALLVGGALCYLAADLAYTAHLDQGLDASSPAWIDTLWLAAYGLYLLAALHPSARLVGRLERTERRPISRSRLLLSGLALLAPIVALAVNGPDPAHAAMAVVAEAVLVALVMVRLSDLAAGERRARQTVIDRERYFRSLVQNAAEAMVVLDETGVVTDASPAVRSLLAVDPDDLLGRRLVDAVGALDHDAVEAMLATALASPDVVITGEVGVVGDDRTWWLEMRVTNLVGDPAVGGVVVNLHDVTARHQVQVDLERRAFTDPLTGLANRALFQDRLDQLLSRRDRPELAIVYLDLDGFKAVNDRFGHAEGDRLLELTAARLAAVVRTEDTVARLGGDEFAVLIHGDDATLVAEEVADRIVVELRRPLSVGSERVPMAVSVGVARSPVGSTEGARALMHAADEAMYRAKRGGGDRVVLLPARLGGASVLTDALDASGTTTAAAG